MFYTQRQLSSMNGHHQNAIPDKTTTYASNEDEPYTSASQHNQFLTNLHNSEYLASKTTMLLQPYCPSCGIWEYQWQVTLVLKNNMLEEETPLPGVTHSRGSLTLSDFILFIADGKVHSTGKVSDVPSIQQSLIPSSCSRLLRCGRKVGFTLILAGPSPAVSKPTVSVCLCTYLLIGKTESYKYSIRKIISTTKLLLPNRPAESKHCCLMR